MSVSVTHTHIELTYLLTYLVTYLLTYSCGAHCLQSSAAVRLDDLLTDAFGREDVEATCPMSWCELFLFYACIDIQFRIGVEFTGVCHWFSSVSMSVH